VRDQVAIAMDWMPTIAFYCGINLPNRKIDGINIAEIIKNKKTKSPHDVLHWQKRIRPDRKTQWAILSGKWKLVANGPSTEFKGKKIPEAEYFLSDLEVDPGETNNLASKHPEIVQKLTNLHEKWAKEVEIQN
jgi:arylsulfatase A-like enzyme